MQGGAKAKQTQGQVTCQPLCQSLHRAKRLARGFIYHIHTVKHTSTPCNSQSVSQPASQQTTNQQEKINNKNKQSTNHTTKTTKTNNSKISNTIQTQSRRHDSTATMELKNPRVRTLSFKILSSSSSSVTTPQRQQQRQQELLEGLSSSESSTAIWSRRPSQILQQPGTTSRP